ncbi:MAG: hydrogenase maturation protease [Vicinamibacterales bacterium]|nr:hydrogenase maturation protease [Vicinamibacterales bacterium]
MSAGAEARGVAPRVLVVGYGNPARGDDGLGPALADRLEALALEGVTVDADYQLSVEHAALAAEHDVVVFADATSRGDRAFSFAPLAPTGDTAFCEHAVTPAQVLGLAASCFGATPAGYVLGIRGHALDGFDEGLTPEARAGLEAALGHLVRFIETTRGETVDGGR